MSELTIPRWGATHGLSKAGSHKAVRRCGIPVVDGKVDPAVADVLYRERTRQRMKPARSGESVTATASAGSTPAGVSYTEARRRREVAEATTAELRLAELAGTLVLREAVDRMLFLAARVMRDQMLAIAPRLAAPLAAMTDPKAIELRIGDDVRIALHAFARTLRDGGFAEASPAPEPADKPVEHGQR